MQHRRTYELNIFWIKIDKQTLTALIHDILQAYTPTDIRPPFYRMEIETKDKIDLKTTALYMICLRLTVASFKQMGLQI